MPPQPLLMLLVMLLVWSCLTAFARLASIAINDKKLEQLAEENERAKKLHCRLEKDAAGLIGSMELLEEFLAFFFAVTVVCGFFGPLREVLLGWRLQNQFSGISVTVLLLSVILVFFYLVFWKKVPERLAAKYGEKAALLFAGYCCFVSTIGKPFLWLPTVISNLIARIFGVAPHDMEEEITEEEIRMMVDIGSESGAIDDDEKEMIHNIFELDDKPVEDIMTHRKEVCVLWMEESLENWRAYIDETGHTRYPVCDEDIDNVIGTVNSRDVYRFLLNGGDKSGLRSIIRKPYFVPDSMKADELFSRMQQENTHMVVVMDEYGGFQGIVTQKDLLAEIVGELYSEDEEPEQDIVRIDENTWRIKGSVEIEEVEKVMGIPMPEGEYNTFAGLVLEAIETLPEDGKTAEVEVGKMQIKVTSVVRHRIDEAIVCLMQDEIEEMPEE